MGTLFIQKKRSEKFWSHKEAETWFFLAYDFQTHKEMKMQYAFFFKKKKKTGRVCIWVQNVKVHFCYTHIVFII